MLILARKVGQRVEISDKETGKLIATICPIEVRGDQVRLGFEAEDDIVIDREELADQKRAERSAQMVISAAGSSEGRLESPICT